ncbi:DUF5325 family protein [Sporolactobacillus sp. Y61]|jgi:hypothetical protein|uniref:DUF5325 family protein n=1 Tax=Sporolactobacillus sp. Y61 TaxID=3160863 RepID=A0AAU8IC52_9BACL|nr:DUF5325 family protein [Sporolactobacillus sp. THM19-2]RYL92843.1 hypothetical protein EWH91_05985 [Sporolactobacillus sp. THM19-2]
MQFLFILLACLVVASLIGIGGGLAYGNPVVTMLSVFAVILFMWLGFFVKSRQQHADKKNP